MMEDLDEIADGKQEMPKLANFDKGVALYKLAKDFAKRDADGAKPIQADLKKLLALKDFNEFNKQAAKLGEVYPLPFGFHVEADMKNTKVNVLQFAGPGTFLPDTTSYEQEDAEKLLNILKKQTFALLKLADVSEDEVKDLVEAGLAFDKKLSKVVKSTEEWSDYPAAYNPYLKLESTK